MCRSRRELSNAYLLAKFGFDTAENEPSKICRLDELETDAASYERTGRPRRASPRRPGSRRRPYPAFARLRIGSLEGSFSAVSKPNFASKYAFESSRRDLHNALESNPPMKRNGRKEEDGKTGRKGKASYGRE